LNSRAIEIAALIRTNNFTASKKLDEVYITETISANREKKMIGHHLSNNQKYKSKAPTADESFISELC
jgi:hypothetical protein